MKLQLPKSASHTFHQTPHVRNKETTSEAQEDQGKLKPLIRRLKKTTGFHLHTFTLKQKIDKAL
jgi:hypothetical protein